MVSNEFGQPIGIDVPDWRPRPAPARLPLDGRTCRLEPLTEAHTRDLHQALNLDSPPQTWTYYPQGPFADEAAFADYLSDLRAGPDALPFAIVVAGRALGIACYLRIAPANGSIEIGHIVLGAELQRTTAATEAIYLTMRHAFDDLGYRRFEWKCDSANAPSVRAAARFGFTPEGIHRQALVYRGRNRDTAWFSILDSEWPPRRVEFERWLAPENFDATGAQQTPLRCQDLDLET